MAASLLQWLTCCTIILATPTAEPGMCHTCLDGPSHPDSAACSWERRWELPLPYATTTGSEGRTCPTMASILQVITPSQTLVSLRDSPVLHPLWESQEPTSLHAPWQVSGFSSLQPSTPFCDVGLCSSFTHSFCTLPVLYAPCSQQSLIRGGFGFLVPHPSAHQASVFLGTQLFLTTEPKGCSYSGCTGHAVFPTPKGSLLQRDNKIDAHLHPSPLLTPSATAV